MIIYEVWDAIEAQSYFYPTKKRALKGWKYITEGEFSKITVADPFEVDGNRDLYCRLLNNSMYRTKKEIIETKDEDEDRSEVIDQAFEISFGVELRQEWCTEEHDETNNYLCYPPDGACTCGEYKRHVHCAHGAIIQTG